MNVYQDEGYKDRNDYLRGLADDYGVGLNVVFTMADLLGPGEDFDGLVTAVRRYADGTCSFM